jgi:hypothetical protein
MFLGILTEFASYRDSLPNNLIARQQWAALESLPPSARMIHFAELEDIVYEKLISRFGYGCGCISGMLLLNAYPVEAPVLGKPVKCVLFYYKTCAGRFNTSLQNREWHDKKWTVTLDEQPIDMKVQVYGQYLVFAPTKPGLYVFTNKESKIFVRI